MVRAIIGTQTWWRTSPRAAIVYLQRCSVISNRSELIALGVKKDPALGVVDGGMSAGWPVAAVHDGRARFFRTFQAAGGQPEGYVASSG